MSSKKPPLEVAFLWALLVGTGGAAATLLAQQREGIEVGKGICAAVTALLVLAGFGPSEEHRQIAALREIVARDQRDPSAVQFRDERLVKGVALCGAVNGKNEFGAYSGFTRFVAAKELGALVQGAKSGAGGQFEFAWASFCAGE